MINKKYNWIAATLANDENSTDTELLEYFIKEGKMKRDEAEYYVKQRDKFLNDLNAKLDIYKRKAIKL